MVNTPSATRFRGGDLTQMRKSAEALRRRGVEVVESFDVEPDGRGFDVAHVFNLRTIQSTPRQVRHLKDQGIPVALSPIYLNPSFALWGTRVVKSIFRGERTDDEIERLLLKLSGRTAMIRTSGGAVLSATAENRPRGHYDRIQRATLDGVDYLMPNSILEMNALVRTLGRFDLPFTVVPYAADPATFLDPDPEPFVRRFGLRDFVLQAGRIEASKNQVLLAWALRGLDVPLVLIGGNMQNRYEQWCRQHGPKHLHIIDHLSSDTLAAAYGAARVHVLPSWIETCGLSTMEAALADCSVVASTAGYEIEYFRDLAYYCDPSDHASIRTAVERSLDHYDRDQERRLDLKRLILSEYTWDRAADLMLRCYGRMGGN